MQIFQISEDHSPAQYGVTAMVSQLIGYLAEQGWSTTVLAAGPANSPVPEGVGLVEFPLWSGGQVWRCPKNMKSYLEGLGREPGNIFHLHGVWMAPQWLAARTAARHRIPTILSPHGFLKPRAWQHGHLRRVKKSAYWYTMAYPAFRRLSVIHVFTPQERDYVARLFPGQRLEMIPNAIDLEDADNLISESDKESSLPVNGPYVLFLGRLNPLKGVDLLIKAFAQSVKNSNFRLVIVGPDSTPAYTAKLKSLVRHLGMEARVTFPGPVFGPQKWRLYQGARALCIPSHSEVVGMVNLEAAAAAVPVVTTHETGLFDWEEGGGLLVNPRIEELTRALEQVFFWSDQERADRGRQLRQLVQRHYCWEVVGPQWLELYASLL